VIPHTVAGLTSRVYAESDSPAKSRARIGVNEDHGSLGNMGKARRYSCLLRPTTARIAHVNKNIFTGLVV